MNLLALNLRRVFLDSLLCHLTLLPGPELTLVLSDESSGHSLAHLNILSSAVDNIIHHIMNLLRCLTYCIKHCPALFISSLRTVLDMFSDTLIDNFIDSLVLIGYGANLPSET